ncbi:tripartite motif-containing protein 45-like [Ostrea edulis]|uniref:tripartite motif-containing protein 45-like n=1 Tax=Ostrea edulis TaxID=37623 RepID=UPI0024AFDE07|nr:tripartite motif-containing protein 45-like [Ostrea edulis]
MATSLDSSTTEDVTFCSICIEKFKSPRFLPCTHSFCHKCLSSYIDNVCKSTEPRLGFNCPLCREYIPIDNALGEPEKWAELFPENEVLGKLLQESEQTQCETCLRQSEVEYATDFCFFCMEYLCKLCTKYHKRSLTTLDHKTVPVNKMKGMNITPRIGRENMCSTHQDRKLELFCNDHEEPCCAMCVSTEHRKCESVDAIKKTAETLREILSHNFDSLSEDIHILENKLVDAKKEQERFVTEWMIKQTRLQRIPRENFGLLSITCSI